MNLNRRIAILLAAATPLLLAACDGDDGGTEIRGPGVVSLVLTDAPESASTVVGPGALLRADEARRFTGTFRALVTVEVSTDGESWVRVGGETLATLPLSIGERMVAYGDSVAEGEYSHVKLMVRLASAEIDAGVEVDGVSLDSAAVWIMDEGEIVEVRKEVFPFVVDGSRSMEVVAELNSRAWINAGAVQRGTVSGSEFLRAVELEVLRR